MNIPQVDNHSEGPFLSIKQMVPLPAITPWGNLQLKSMKIVQRIEHINVRIKQAYDSYQRIRSNQIMAYDVSLFEAEEIIYWIRKTVDEMIQLIFVLEEFKRNGEWPTKIDIDCIGTLLENPNSDVYRIFEGHYAKLKQLNEVGNAYKHSFVGTDITLLGRDELCVFSLSVGRNNLSQKTRFNSIRLADFVQHFNEFYQFIRSKCFEFIESPQNKEKRISPEKETE
jgi:hypothetical protein